MTWQQLYSGIWIMDDDFNEAHAPLESEDELAPVFEKRFEGRATGYKRLEQIEADGQFLAKPRATGLYLQAHPDRYHFDQPMLGGGLLGIRGYLRIPLFHVLDHEPSVELVRLDHEFGSGFIWLVSPIPGK
jgi:hypothetical protein